MFTVNIIFTNLFFKCDNIFFSTFEFEPVFSQPITVFMNNSNIYLKKMKQLTILVFKTCACPNPISG